VDENRILAIRAVQGRIDVELASLERFQVRGDRLVLVLADVQSSRSRHPDGDLTRVIFTLEVAEFASVPNGTRVLVRYGANDAREWDFGPLDKAMLAP
jgi:hypothetical protein